MSIPSVRFTTAFGAAERLTIKIGKGPDEGKMLISADTEGAFRPTFLKSAVIIRFPDMEWAPGFDAAAEEPEIHRTADGLVVTLPEWAWSAERQKAIRKAREQVSRERAAERAR